MKSGLNLLIGRQGAEDVHTPLLLNVNIHAPVADRRIVLVHVHVRQTKIKGSLQFQKKFDFSLLNQCNKLNLYIFVAAEMCHAEAKKILAIIASELRKINILKCIIV